MPELHSHFSLQLMSQVTQVIKNPPAILETQEMQVQSLVLKDPLQEKMATHSNIIAW